jgi:uncharacterized lipoprotein
MKRLVKKLAVAAVACLMVMALAGCDLLGTMQKSGLSPQLTKDRFSPPGAPSGVHDRHNSATFVPIPGAAVLMP